MKQTPHLTLFAGALMLAVLACGPIDTARDILGRLPTTTPTAASEEHSSTVWYVETDGDDGRVCSESSFPCRTVSHVLYDLATDDDVIMVGPGTYAEPIRVGVMFRIQDLDLRIEGASQESTIFDAQDEGTGILISGDSRVTLRNFSVRNGADNAPGNCISHRSSSTVVIESVSVEHCTRAGIEHYSEGELRLIDVSVSGAYWTSPGNGGSGVSNFGPMMIEGGEFSDNAGAGVAGGPLQMTGARMERNGLDGLVLGGVSTVEGVTVVGNDIDPSLGANHAGISVEDGAVADVSGAEIGGNDIGVRAHSGSQLTLRNSTVSGHPRNGLLIKEGSEVNLIGVTIEGNGSFYAETSLPAGIDNRGQLSMLGSVVRGNHNGGIGNYGDLQMRDSWVTGNDGRLAGLYNFGDASVQTSLFSGQIGTEAGVENRGTMALENSTVSGNAHNGIAGVSGSLTLSYVTVADNGYIGLNAHTAGEVVDSISNSLFARHPGRSNCLFGSVYLVPAALGTNLDSDGSCGLGGTTSEAALALGPLQDNGGPTMTHAIDGDSAALDAATGSCPEVDQRGQMRPAGVACDVGAYELGPFALSAEGTPVVLATVTPASAGGGPTVITDTLCWKGPGPLYEVVSSLAKGTQVQILGRGVEGDWWVIDNPRYPGVRCWAPGEDIQVQPNYEYPNTLFEIPPLPTPTPTPILGCLWYDENQAEACFPIDQCPVDFGDSNGACTP